MHQLAIAGKPIQEEDLILYILQGYPHEYDSFGVSISTRSESALIKLSELHNLLLSQKAHLSEADESKKDLHEANFVQRGSNRGNYRGGRGGQGRFRGCSSGGRFYGRSPNSN